MYPQAIEQFDDIRKRYPGNAALLMAYGHALGVSGDRQGAQNVLNELLSEAHTRYVPSVYIAALYTSLGDKEQAFQWLDRAYEEKSDRLVYLGVEPISDPLRNDPRFGKLMKKVGLH
jgi:predicted Zn-dependent protease